MRIKKKIYIQLSTAVFSKKALFKYRTSLKKKWKFMKFQQNKFYNISAKRQIVCKSIKKLYIERLKLKQTLKQLYGSIREKTFKRLYYRANKNPIKIITSLEMQLNVLVFKSTNIPTLAAVGSLINSGNILVNNKTLLKKSIALKPGDIITLTTNSFHFLKNTLSYIEINERLNKFIVLSNPNTLKIPFSVKLPLYLGFEFYKK